MAGLDQTRARAASRSATHVEPIELGHEPPLSVDGITVGLVDRRRVSVQWFAGTILTALVQGSGNELQTLTLAGNSPDTVTLVNEHTGASPESSVADTDTATVST